MYWNLNSSRPERANFLLVLNCMTTKLIFPEIIPDGGCFYGLLCWSLFTKLFGAQHAEMNVHKADSFKL